MPAVKEKLNTPAMKAHKAAQAAYTTAKEKAAKASNDVTKAALAKAHDALKSATTAVNTERFSRVGSARVTKAVAMIAQVSAVFNPRSYVYTRTQGEGAIKYLRDAVDAAEKAFVESLNPVTTAAKGKATITL